MKPCWIEDTRLEIGVPRISTLGSDEKIPFTGAFRWVGVWSVSGDMGDVTVNGSDSADALGDDGDAVSGDASNGTGSRSCEGAFGAVSSCTGCTGVEERSPVGRAVSSEPRGSGAEIGVVGCETLSLTAMTCISFFSTSLWLADTTRLLAILDLTEETAKAFVALAILFVLVFGSITDGFRAATVAFTRASWETVGFMTPPPRVEAVGALEDEVEDARAVLLD